MRLNLRLKTEATTQSETEHEVTRGGVLGRKTCEQTLYIQTCFGTTPRIESALAFSSTNLVVRRGCWGGSCHHFVFRFALHSLNTPPPHRLTTPLTPPPTRQHPATSSPHHRYVLHFKAAWHKAIVLAPVSSLLQLFR